MTFQDKGKRIRVEPVEAPSKPAPAPAPAKAPEKTPQKV